VLYACGGFQLCFEDFASKLFLSMITVLHKQQICLQFTHTFRLLFSLYLKYVFQAQMVSVKSTVLPTALHYRNIYTQTEWN